MNAIDESIAWHKRQQGRASSGIAFVAGYEIGAASVRSQEHPNAVELRECRAEKSALVRRVLELEADIRDLLRAAREAGGW